MMARWQHDGVEGVRCGRFAGGVNTASVLYRLGDTLIDCGAPHQHAVVRAFARERTLRRLLLTHHHEDHSGNAGTLQNDRSLRVFAHPAALVPLANGFSLAPYQRLLFGRPQPVRARVLPPLIEVADGSTLFVLHTPGHAADHVCYLEPQRGWLFTGDLFVGRQPRYLRYDEDLDALIASLRRLLREEFATVFCGHRGVVPDGRRALQDKLDYLLDLRGAACRLAAAGWTERAICRQLLGREDLAMLVTLGHFSKRLLIRACLATESPAPTTLAA